MKPLHFLLLISALSMTSCVAPDPDHSGTQAPLPAPSSPAPQSWDAWAAWVEARRPVGDGAGHGPDVGSEEWAWALDRQLGISDASGHGPDLRSDEWRQAVESRLN